MAADLNIVFIVADTFRRDHLGIYGNSMVQTPHLDRFASESVVFDHHIIGSFPTMPARIDLLTGVTGFKTFGWEPLPPDLTTLPRILGDAGYLTMGVVDVPFFIREGWGYDRGFDDFIWIRGQGDDSRPQERIDARSTWVREADRLAVRTMKTAEEWLERHYREKFFLYVDTWDPHEPWDAPMFYTNLYSPDYDGRDVFPTYNKWQETDLTEADLTFAHAAYCGEITMVDRWIGFLLDKLRVLGIAGDTLVIFASDHGFYFGEHGYFGKANWFEANNITLSDDAAVPEWLGTSWPVTILRSPLYQEITRVPLIVRLPGVSPSRRNALTTAADIPVTVLDIVGADALPNMDGRSFSRVLHGELAEHRDFVVSSWPLYFAEGEYTSSIDSRPRQISKMMPVTVTNREFSLLIGAPDEPPELYDLSVDPKEGINCWDQHLDQGVILLRDALDYLAARGTPAQYLAPHYESLSGFSS